MAIDPNSSTAATTTTTTTTATTAAATTNPIHRPPSRPTSTATGNVSPQTQLSRLPPDLFAVNICPLPPRKYIPASSSAPAPAQGIPYPVASSGRGFISIPKTAAEQAVTVANPGGGGGGGTGYPPRPVANYVVRPIQPHQHLHHYHHPHHHQQHPHIVGPVKGVPVSVQPKVVPLPSIPECNGYKDMRDKSRDESLTLVRDRKVRIIEGASLYTLCRSWLRNGFPEEIQAQYGDPVRSLPKPLPIPVTTSTPQKKEGGEGEDEGDEEEDEQSVENLSAEDLFKRHVKRAKKVRAQLREVRLKRIARYKSRLALLLPPLVEQIRNDAAAGT